MPAPTPRSRALSRVRTTVTLAVVALVALPLTAWSDAVVVVVDGEHHQIHTSAETVADVLDELEVDVEPEDAVSPPPGTPVSHGLEIDVTRAIDLNVIVDGEVHPVTAPVSSVAGAIEEAGLGSVRQLGAEIVPPWTSPVENGDTITVSTPALVTLTVDGERHYVRSTVTTVEHLLVQQEVELGEHDLVTPPLDAPLDRGSEVLIRRVDFDEVIVEVALEHGEERRETDDLEKGKTKVKVTGADGLRHDVYRVELVDGEEVDRELVNQEVVEEPQDRVVLVGTFEPPPPPPPPPPRPRPASSSSSPGPSASPSDDGVWDRLARCESGGNWAANTGNGYYGGLQFRADTWRSVGGSGLPHEHPREVQIEMGKRLQARAGWGAWPHCSARLGLR